MVTPERRSHLVLHSCPLSLNGGGEETRKPSPRPPRHTPAAQRKRQEGRDLSYPQCLRPHLAHSKRSINCLMSSHWREEETGSGGQDLPTVALVSEEIRHERARDSEPGPVF